jgi:hypothetical protein
MDPTITDPDMHKVVRPHRRRGPWLDAQTHSGENVGDTPTHVVFVELKSLGSAPAGESLGPS